MTWHPVEVLQIQGRDGAAIYGERHGQGSIPILFIYGIACTMNHWFYQVQDLSSRFEVYIFDLRGHGKSQSGFSKNQSLSGIVSDFELIIEHLGFNKIHLVGHSFGVPICLELTKKVPHRIASLTLFNGFIQDPLKNFFGLNLTDTLLKWVYQMHELDPEAFNQVWDKILNNPLNPFFAGFLGGFNLSATAFKDIQIYFNGVKALNPKVFLNLLRSLCEYDGRSGLKRLHHSTLIVGGQKDGITPPKHQKLISRFIPKSELLIVPEASHCVQLDFPKFASLLIQDHILKVHGLSVA